LVLTSLGQVSSGTKVAIMGDALPANGQQPLKISKGKRGDKRKKNGQSGERTKGQKRKLQEANL